MQLLRIAIPVALTVFVSSVHSATTLLSYDRSYDSPEGSLTAVACSDGSHGMITRGYKTYGSIPKFPYIGGGEVVEGWNSPNCGLCYQLTYRNASGVAKSIYITVIDRAQRGFNVALPAMQALVGQNAADVGTVQVESKQVSPKSCGFT